MEFTDEIKKAFEKQGDTSLKSMSEIKIVCIIKLDLVDFCWYLYDKIDDDIYMCFANLNNPIFAECGSVSLREIESVNPYLKPRIDESYKPLSMTLKEVIDKVNSGDEV